MQILIADGQPSVRYALRVLLECQPGSRVVGEAAHAEELLRQAAETDPDLVLLAMDLPGRPPGDLIHKLRLKCPHLTVIALSSRPELQAAALAAGADAFVSKADPPDRLLTALGKGANQVKTPGRKE